MVVVKDSLSKSQPEAVREIYRLLAESKRAAKLPKPGSSTRTPSVWRPTGQSRGRHRLRLSAEMIPRPIHVDELFDDVTRKLG